MRVDFAEQKIDAIFAELNQCQLPGAAVGIAVHGAPVYRKAFGLANMELPALLTPAMRLRIASITKHFTSLAWMLLCEDGLAGLDEPIGKYLPELHPMCHAVTPRQLMGNISGLRDAHDVCWHFSGTGSVVAAEQLFALYREMGDVNAAPGTAYIYNNGGFLLLCMAMERITNESFDLILRRRIFDPVGMPDTMLRRNDTDFVPNSATLHPTSGKAGFAKSYSGTETSGEGGLVSTVNDMLRWLAHMDAPIVGCRKTWEIMKWPMTLPNGCSTEYGLGLIRRKYRGIETLSHSGGAHGGQAYMLKVPAAGLDVVVLMNRRDVGVHLLTYRILDTCLNGLEPTQEPLKQPIATGLYRSLQSGRVVQLFAKEGGQVVSLYGCDFVRYFESIDDRVLRPIPQIAGYPITLKLIGDPEHPNALHVVEYGEHDELAVVQCRHEPLDAIEGGYRARLVGATATIAASDTGPKLHTGTRFGSVTYSLECLSEGLWKGTPPVSMPLAGCLLNFDAERKRFEFTNLRTRAVEFQRE